MKNVLRTLVLAVVVCGSALLVQSTASAHGGHGGHNFNGNGGQTYFGGYNPAFGGFLPSQPRWHDTTHLDYYPAQLQRHGNHFDVVPGHYDLHRSGHWDR